MLSGQPITDVIDFPVMEPGILIRTERLKRDWSQAELGKRVGISQVAIKKIEANKTLKSKFLPKIAEVLSIPLSKLDRSLSQHGNETINQAREVNPPKHRPALQTFPQEQLIGEVDLPVYSIVQGGRGALVLENEPYTHVARPRRLVNVRGGYGVLVRGNSCAREYNEGDIAYVDPNLHPRKNDPCVFQSTKDDGTVEAMIKYLDRSPDASETVYYVSQTNPEKAFTIKKSEWQKCHVAVGKESGR